MKRIKVDKYAAGYTGCSIGQKCAAGALGVMMLGALAGCEPTYAGNMTVEEYDGNMTVVVSESDATACESETFDGDAIPAPEDGGNGAS